MIYNFTHYQTPDGRRVQFMAARGDVEPAARVLGSSWFVTNTRAGEHGEVVVTARPRAARELADALAGLGGKAAVAARMLTEALDDMVVELRASRPTAVQVKLWELAGDLPTTAPTPTRRARPILELERRLA